VDNEEPVIGNTTEINSQELKRRIVNSFSSQGRAVTLEDYKAICYSMPPELGSVKRVAIAKDLDSLRRNLNIYVLSEHKQGYLTNSTDTLKENLKNWIAKNKIVNDSIDILDGKIINYEIVFKALASREADKIQVLNDSIKAISKEFSITAEMGEPLIISDIMAALKKVNGLVDVVTVKINLKQNGNYSSTYFNIEENTSEDGRVINVPLNAVMELKYPDIDIRGTII
jgi:phage-related baseplate assembly protein